MKKPAPLCYVCGKHRVTADPTPDPHRDPAGEPAPARLCDACRKRAANVQRAGDRSDEETLVLQQARALGVDSVGVLWSAIEKARKQLERDHRVMPGVSNRTARVLKQTVAFLGLDRAKETVDEEAARTGRTSRQIRMRDLRARRKTQPKG